jgi:hypothetical protein
MYSSRWNPSDNDDNPSASGCRTAVVGAGIAGAIGGIMIIVPALSYSGEGTLQALFGAFLVLPVFMFVGAGIGA